MLIQVTGGEKREEGRVQYLPTEESKMHAQYNEHDGDGDGNGNGNGNNASSTSTSDNDSDDWKSRI